MPRSQEDQQWMDKFEDMIARVTRLRTGLIEQVCWYAVAADAPYGVLVDGKGVRIDKAVPRREIHYADSQEFSLSFSADFTIPD